MFCISAGFVREITQIPGPEKLRKTTYFKTYLFCRRKCYQLTANVRENVNHKKNVDFSYLISLTSTHVTKWSLINLHFKECIVILFSSNLNMVASSEQ